jgi:hypothetical protein
MLRLPSTLFFLVLTILLSPIFGLVLFQRSDSFGACTSLSILVQVKLFNPNDTLSSTTNKRFSFSNIYNYQNINAIGMALNGLNTSLATVLNFIAQPSYSLSNNSFVITLIVDANNTAGLTLLAYSIIVIDSSVSTFLDLQSQCTSFVYLRLHPYPYNTGQSQLKLLPIFKHHQPHSNR